MLCDDVEQTVQGKFFVRLGHNLVSMLRGDIDPLTFMFEDDAVPEFYREVNREVVCYEPLKKYLKLLCHKNPGFKMLEIGAGTGSTTDYILNALSSHPQSATGPLQCSQYDYTDISPAFFEGASERYRIHGDRLRFKVLDIESDPSKQGFELGTYDLIFAASVFHATKNLETTIRNARALLKTGGKLIIWEITQDVLRARFAFGLLPGWWLSEEDNRQDGPCISTCEWNRRMCLNGFSGVELEIPDYLEAGCHEYSILISTAVETSPIEAIRPPIASTSDPALIIIPNNDTFPKPMADRLKNEYSSLGTHNDCVIVTLEQASAMNDLQSRICFSLLEVRGPFLPDIDEKSFGQLRHILTTIQ